MSCNCKKPSYHHHHPHHPPYHKPDVGFDPCYEHDECPRHCDCYHDVNSLCVVYKGEDLETLGIKKCTRLEDILKHLDKLWLNKFFQNHPLFSGKNLGDGKGLYKGVTNDGYEGFRSLINSDNIIFTEDGDTIQANINLPWLKEYIKEKEYIKVGRGVSAVRVEDNKIKNRCFTSTNNSIDIGLNPDESVNVEVNYKTLKNYLGETRGTLYDIYVDTNSDEDIGEGTIDNPFTTFSTAYNYIIGNGSAEDPEFKNRRIILLSDTSIFYNPYINNTELCLRNVTLSGSHNIDKKAFLSLEGSNRDQTFRISGTGTIQVEKGSTLMYIGSSDASSEVILEGDILLRGNSSNNPLIRLEGDTSTLHSKGHLILSNEKGTFIDIDKATFKFNHLLLDSQEKDIKNSIFVLEKAILKGGVIELKESLQKDLSWDCFYEVLSDSYIDTAYHLNRGYTIGNFLQLVKGVNQFVLGSFKNNSYMELVINQLLKTKESQFHLEIRNFLLGDIKQYCDTRHTKITTTIKGFNLNTK